MPQILSTTLPDKTAKAVRKYARQNKWSISQTISELLAESRTLKTLVRTDPPKRERRADP